MAPSRKSRSVNKQFANEVSTNKLADSANKNKKRKISNLLGPQWSKQELERFYNAYRKHGKDWKKVATAVRNRSAEMAEALYSMNKAYLSLPEGAASVIGLVAMMTDHYDVLGENNSDLENTDDGGSRPKKRAKGNSAFRGSDEHLSKSRSQPVATSDTYLSLLNKKRSENLPRAVRKRTPRVPFSYLDKDKERRASPAKQRLKLILDPDDDEVTHEVAMALTNVSQRSNSRKLLRDANMKQDSALPSPRKDGGRMRSGAQMTSSEPQYTSFHDGSRKLSLRIKEGGNMERLREKRSSMGSKSAGPLSVQERGKNREVKKREVENGTSDQLDAVIEASNTTNEKTLRAVKRKGQTETVDGEKRRARPKGSQKRGRKSLFGDEGSPFDALQTLADMSLMMRSTTDITESRAEGKEENVDAASRYKLNNQHGISDVVKPSTESAKQGKTKAGDQESTIGVKKRKQKSPMKLQVKEKKTQDDSRLTDNLNIEATNEAKSSFYKDQRPPLNSENLREKSANALGFTYLGDNSKRKVSVLRSEAPSKEAGIWKFLEASRKEKERYNNNIDQGPVNPVLTRELDLKERLSNCLSRLLARRWCKFEWFYSAIDYPWFARSEFVEYLQHVALDHIPRLTRVEWNVIKGSLGRPRRFSNNFLKEEKEKLKQYRESVRKHYAELRAGTREGLPTDLAQPLSVGQHIVAIHPMTRDIQNGTVLAVEHSRYHVKFDLPGLEAKYVMDFECMPRNLTDSKPVSLRGRTPKEQKPKKPVIEQETEVPVVFLSNKDIVTAESQSVAPSSLSDVDELLRCKEPPIETQVQIKEADIQALSDLFRALDKKDAVNFELRFMNDALENDKDLDNPLRDSEAFQRQHAAILLLLHEVNLQVSSSLIRLRERNRYQKISPPPNKKQEAKSNDYNIINNVCSKSNSVTPYIYKDIGSQVDEIIENSRTKARKVVDVALEAIANLEKMGEDWVTIEATEEAINFVNDRLSEEDFEALSTANPAPAKPSLRKLTSTETEKITVDPESTQKSDLSEPKIASELIAHCVATLLMIQKCTERQFPPSEVAQVLDSAVTDLHPLCTNNLSVYEEIQKYMGIIRTQILALIPS